MLKNDIIILSSARCSITLKKIENTFVKKVPKFKNSQLTQRQTASSTGHVTMAACKGYASQFLIPPEYRYI